jgi:hypothetical protein
LKYRIIFLVIAILGFACETKLPEEFQQANMNLPETVDYNFHIKPILANKCYNCHGPDANTRKANLRLDVEEQAFAILSSGNSAFTKGSLRNSEVIHRLLSNDPEIQMPPPDSKLQISSEEIALIAKWIEQGAEWKTHWAYQKVNKPKLPEVNTEGSGNAIDYFIEAERSRRGLKPNAQADKERLLRRVTMDLTGLPPTIEAMDAFLVDNSDDAYEKVVDKLLASTAHAERLAMDWLDIARYSDSHGVSFDGYRNMWPYRDWVIKAFGANMPFDQFITKQVAGDLLPNATEQDLLATAFYRMNPMEASQGSIEEEYRVEYVAERTATTGTAFLGLTVGCARCHDHKFDAISHKEYYQISAFFNNVAELGLGPRDLNRPPTIILFDDAAQKELDALNEQLSAKYESKSKSDLASLVSYVNNLESTASNGLVGYYPFDALEKIKRKEKINFLAKEFIATKKKEAEEEAKAELAKASKEEQAKAAAKKKKKKKKQEKIEWEELQIVDATDGVEATLGVTVATTGVKGNSLSFDSDYDYVSLTKLPIFDFYDDFSASLYVKPKAHVLSKTKTLLTSSTSYSSFFRGWEFSMDSLNRLSLRLIHRMPDNYIEVVSESAVAFDEWSQVAFSYAGMGKATDITIYINGKAQKTTVLKDELTRTIKPFHDYFSKEDSVPVRLGKSYREYTGDVGIYMGLMDEVKIFSRSLSSLEMAQLANIKATDAMYASHKEQSSTTYQEKRNSMQHLLKNRAELLEKGEEVMVMGDAQEKRQTYILSMGLYDQYLEPVEPGGIDAVIPYPADYPKNRLGLAQWLTNKDNPLTARVTINRYWQMIYGVGLVKTTEDFGIQGALPSHPELLDWLAAEFIDSGWDVKHMLKLMVMSNTYKQSSKIEKYAYEIDPENKYFARSNSYRLPAEMIRDNALAVSGLLEKEVGGKSVKPYQPEGLWKELVFSHKLSEYKQDTASSLYRRSMYTFSRRFSPPPFMANFDAPNREICITRRVNTNTPLQALNLLNDPQFIETSRVLSERAQKNFDTVEEQLSYSFRLSTGVKPSDYLMNAMKEQYTSALLHFQKNPEKADSLLAIGDMPFDIKLDKNKTAALAMVTSTIFNFDETYMKR